MVYYDIREEVDNINSLINLIKISTHQSSKDKIIIDTIDMGHYTNDLILGVLVIVRKDFDIDNIETKVVSETDSFQIRPKSLYKSNKGIYYKDGSERRYLSTQEKVDLKIKNPDLGKYLM